ncbi:MAG: hypothetical protein ABI459_06345 [Deltaproteobacteria bacterium]
MKNYIRSSAAVAMTFGLIACSTAGSDAMLAATEQAQRAAYDQCSAQLGVAAYLQKLDLRNGQVSLFAVNENGVTIAQARSLNDCAKGRLLATQGA